MSTKITIEYGERFHLYRDCFEMEDPDTSIAGRVWLEMSNTDFKVLPHRVQVALPPEVLCAMRLFLTYDKNTGTEAQLKYLDLCSALVRYKEAIEEGREEDAQKLRERMFTHVY